MDITNRLLVRSIPEADATLLTEDVAAIVSVIGKGEIGLKADGQNFLKRIAQMETPHKIFDIFEMQATHADMQRAIDETTALCTRDDDQKIITHCTLGKSRSFTFAMVVANLQDGGADVLDKTLAKLTVKRPEGDPLESPFLNFVYGKRMRNVRETILDFSAAKEEREQLRNRFWRYSDPTMQQVDLSKIPEDQREIAQRVLNAHNKTATRFGMEFTVMGG